LKVEWSQKPSLPGHQGVKSWMVQAEKSGMEVLVQKGESAKALEQSSNTISATYYWPLQSHASMGPSCGIADVRTDGATIWSASQATHRLRGVCARILGFQPEQVRVIYRDGSGCYGTNGHDDVCADAALISKAIGRPVRVQWSREDELGWDPKGPPQLLTMRGALDEKGHLDVWETDMWLPKATASLPNIPLLGPEAAGIPQQQGISTGLISQNAHPPYAHTNLTVKVNWLKESPLRPSNIRAPGKIANSFAVESFVDELAAHYQRDPLSIRLQGLTDPRGVAVCKKVAELMQWQTRPSPVKQGNKGRGFSYVHYKFNETYVAIGMEVEVDRQSYMVKVNKIYCAQDCGLMINPDATRQQVEGNILQTLSRTLFEETQFDQYKVTSTDWQAYPLLTFPDVPELVIALLDQPHLPPLGAGEAACAAVPAALANAIFDACGARLREVPFTPDRLKAALLKA
jgi:nicotinate dehydrogenase subunit B